MESQKVQKMMHPFMQGEEGIETTQIGGITLPKWLLIVTAIKVALETKTQEKVTKGEIVEGTGDHTNALSKKME